MGAVFARGPILGIWATVTQSRLSLAEPSFSSNKIVLYKVHLLLTFTLGPQHRQQQSQPQGMLQILDANFEEPSEECGPLTSTSSNKIVLNKVDVLNLLTYSTAELQGRRCSGGRGIVEPLYDDMLIHLTTTRTQFNLNSIQEHNSI